MYRSAGEYVSTPLPEVRPERKPLGACDTRDKYGYLAVALIFCVVSFVVGRMYEDAKRTEIV